jgi:hypothetical protein
MVIIKKNRIAANTIAVKTIDHDILFNFLIISSISLLQVVM